MSNKGSKIKTQHREPIFSKLQIKCQAKKLVSMNRLRKFIKQYVLKTNNKKISKIMYKVMQ